MQANKDEEEVDGVSVEADLVDPAIWPKLIAWIKTLPRVEEAEAEAEQEALEPFI